MTRTVCHPNFPPPNQAVPGRPSLVYDGRPKDLMVDGIYLDGFGHLGPIF
jgi:hypothetical protein